jgi:hypothetical protein
VNLPGLMEMFFASRCSDKNKDRWRSDLAPPGFRGRKWIGASQRITTSLNFGSFLPSLWERPAVE